MKKASPNWFKKLKQGLIDHGFHPSAINPCLYSKRGMIIITYVDDCFIISNSIKDINTFVKSMKDSPEGYVLTDEGDVIKTLGIEIKEITKNKFKLSQPFLIKQIVNLLGLGKNEFDVHTNTKITPVGKPLLNKDLEGKPPIKDWKYPTAISMLAYLQGNTSPEISMATHKLAQFFQDSRLNHEQATTRLGRYLAHTKDRDIVYEPDKSMGIECYVDADFAGGWNITTSADADNVMLRTGFVSTYANCPIYWARHLQSEIALGTAKAEYIAMSSALRKVVPPMTLMKE